MFTFKFKFKPPIKANLHYLSTNIKNLNLIYFVNRNFTVRIYVTDIMWFESILLLRDVLVASMEHGRLNNGKQDISDSPLLTSDPCGFTGCSQDVCCFGCSLRADSVHGTIEVQERGK
jgi:hypothetical protein